MNNTPQILEQTILIKSTKQDKFGRDYLLIELENNDKIFVFNSKIKSPRWSELQEGNKYEFTLMESDKGAKSLVEFALIADEFFV